MKVFLFLIFYFLLNIHSIGQIISDSLAKSYYENGKLKSETPYRDGEKNGKAKQYYESGALEISIDYKKGKLSGLTKWFDENGKETAEARYRYDKRIWIAKKNN